MDNKQAGTKHTFFDATAFDAVARDAATRRDMFMRTHPRAILAVAGSATLFCGAALLIGAATHGTRLPSTDMARRGYQMEARVNAATDQLETLNSALERASAITPGTASAIEQQIRQPVYDCNQMPCSAALQQRNYAARARLRSLLARKRLPEEPRIASRVEVENAIK